MSFERKDLLGIKDLSKDEIGFILETAAGFKDVLQRDIKKGSVLALTKKTLLRHSF